MIFQMPLSLLIDICEERNLNIHVTAHANSLNFTLLGRHGRNKIITLCWNKNYLRKQSINNIKAPRLMIRHKYFSPNSYVTFGGFLLKACSPLSKQKNNLFRTEILCDGISVTALHFFLNFYNKWCFHNLWRLIR